MSLVGIIANPASGKDIRRLVAYGSVFDNQEKVRIVRRLLLGLRAAGVDGICFMPDYYGIVLRALDGLDSAFNIAPVDFQAKGEQTDSTHAARIMDEQGVDCIITLGGDGTNRVVAKGTTRVPLLPISTGTNNVFPSMVEATVAGMAAGLVATGAVPLDEGAYRTTRLDVILDGKAVDLALVDVAVCNDLFLASKAVWDLTKVSQIFLNRADPGAIGLSSIGGLLRPIGAEEPHSLSIVLGGTGAYVRAPVAPGTIEKVFISSINTMDVGEEIEIGFTPSVLALDGEREVEVRRGQRAAIRLAKDGPPVVDVSRTMRSAMQRRVLASPVDEGSLRP